MLVKTGPPRGGQKGSLTGGLGTQGDPWFRIVRIRMQNSSAQNTACGRDDVFFFFSGRNSNICGRYDLILLITRCWAEIWTSAEAMTLFLLITWFWAEIRTSADAMTFFCSSRDFGAPLTKGPKRNFCPGARNFSRRPWVKILLTVLQSEMGIYRDNLWAIFYYR